MPESMAWLRAARAGSSSLYMRKRLPEPKPRIGTLSPVRPKVRVGSFEFELAAGEARTVAPLTMVTATVSRNCRRFMREETSGTVQEVTSRKGERKRRGKPESTAEYAEYAERKG